MRTQAGEDRGVEPPASRRQRHPDFDTPLATCRFSLTCGHASRSTRSCRATPPRPNRRSPLTRSISRRSTSRCGERRKATASCSPGSASRCRAPRARSLRGSTPPAPASTVHHCGFGCLSDLFEEGLFAGKGLSARRRVQGDSSTAACRKTRSSPTESVSKACAPGSRWSPTWKWSTIFPRRCWPTPVDSADGGARQLARNPLVAVPMGLFWARRAQPSASDQPLEILDNLQRSLLAPSLLGLLVIGWTLPGRA